MWSVDKTGPGNVGDAGSHESSPVRRGMLGHMSHPQYDASRTSVILAAGIDTTIQLYTHGDTVAGMHVLLPLARVASFSYSPSASGFIY